MTGTSPAEPAAGPGEPIVDVVIAVHDARRPIERAVRSVLDGTSGVRVTVVCHALSSELIRERLGPTDPTSVRVVEFSDGVRSAAGPFNHGLSLATAEYVSIMGSDDFLEPGAMRRWVEYVERESPDVALVRLRFQSGEKLHNPLARARRGRRLHPVKDRMFYRTAPLGLLRRSLVEQLDIRMTEGLRTGEDLAFGVILWTSGVRIDYLRSQPAYVIGSDADERVTTAPMSAEDFFAPVNKVLTDARVASLDRATRRALAVKLARIHLLGYVVGRPEPADWNDADLNHVAETLRRILDFSPAILEPFSRADRDLLDAVLMPTRNQGRIVAAVRQHRSAGRVHTLLPRNLLRIFDRESVPVRYLLYAVGD